MTQTARVVLLLDGRDVRRVKAALDGAGFSCYVAGSDLPENQLYDLVVSSRQDMSCLPRKVLLMLGRGLVGLIRVGQAAGGDVWLPQDWTERELVMCCRLLREIVRLRRAQYRQQRRQQRLKQWAFRDPLTEVPNRRAWQLELLRHSQEPAGHSALLAILDVDHFKKINEQLGLSGGDHVLRTVAQAIRRSLRRDDMVARLGGDEFGLWLDDVIQEAALQVVERVRREASEAATRAAGIPVTLSAGLAFGGTGEPYQLFAQADKALALAKQTGRDRTCSTGPTAGIA